MKFLDSCNNIDYYFNEEFTERKDVYYLNITNSSGLINPELRRLIGFNYINGFGNSIMLKSPYIKLDSIYRDINLLHLGLFDSDNCLVDLKSIYNIMFRLRTFCDKKHIKFLIFTRPLFTELDINYIDFKSLFNRAFSDSGVNIICCIRKDR